MMEHIIEDSPHVTIAEDIEDLVYSQVCCNANTFPVSPLEKSTEQHIPSDPIEHVQKVSLMEDNIEDPLHDIMTKAYKETYDNDNTVCGDTRPCSPHIDEGLESLFPCNILSKEDCYEYKEDMDRQEHDAMDEESTTYDMVGSDDYWNFIDNPTCENFMENPIHDMSNNGSVYSKKFGIPIHSGEHGSECLGKP